MKEVRIESNIPLILISLSIIVIIFIGYIELRKLSKRILLLEIRNSNSIDLSSQPYMVGGDDNNTETESDTYTDINSEEASIVDQLNKEYEEENEQDSHGYSSEQQLGSNLEYDITLHLIIQ